MAPHQDQTFRHIIGPLPIFQLETELWTFCLSNICAATECGPSPEKSSREAPQQGGPLGQLFTTGDGHGMKPAAFILHTKHALSALGCMFVFSFSRAKSLCSVYFMLGAILQEQM